MENVLVGIPHMDLYLIFMFVNLICECIPDWSIGSSILYEEYRKFFRNETGKEATISHKIFSSSLKAHFPRIKIDHAKSGSVFKHIGIRGISDVALENRQGTPGVNNQGILRPNNQVTTTVSPITRRLTRREERDEEKLDRDFVRHYGSNLPEIQNLKRLGLFRRHLKDDGTIDYERTHADTQVAVNEFRKTPEYYPEMYRQARVERIRILGDIKYKNSMGITPDSYGYNSQ